MPRRADLIGRDLGEDCWLTVIAFVGKGKHGQMMWRCKCSCGKETSVSASHLLSGHTTSCGCKRFSEMDRTLTVAATVSKEEKKAIVQEAERLGMTVCELLRSLLVSRKIIEEQP